MSNDHLQPTPIVDKNGKHTTVRRRTTPKKSKYGSPIALTLPKPVKPGTPLKQPAPLTFKEGEEFWDEFLVGRTNVTRPESWMHPNNDEVRLIKRIYDAQEIGDDFLWGLISQMGKLSAGDSYPGYKYNMLLTTERYFQLYPEADQEYPYNFTLMLHGLTHRRSIADRKPVVEITRQEELDGRAATIRFIDKRPNATYGKTDHYKIADGTSLHGTILDPAQLADFIRERPELVDDIIEYIKERGDVHTKAALDTMKSFFETRAEVITPLQNGWL